ncbi:CNH-domain-containing protein [Dichomitus squalens]|uniref:CNH-domain-containing protein n=1 Tax=Dichomitus squalens TaxID=114155 RepID=A0A4Q9PNC6_9APHY|nr:CNH-domain-containing protein [Dichomitus squalens]
MTKPKGKGDDLKYVVWKPPVRVEFLVLSSLSIRPVQRSNTFTRMMRPGRDSPDLSSVLVDSLAEGSHDKSYHPLSFHCYGKHGGTYTLYAATPDERNEWRRRMKEAIGARRAAQAEGSVFQVETITDDTSLPSAHHPGLITGRISCSLPFAKDGHSLVAVGSEDGIWIGMLHQPDTLQRVVSVKHVTQLAFLEEQGSLLVLADKVLHSIDIESIVPTPVPRQHAHQPVLGLQRLSRQGKHVDFFSVGRQAGRILVVYKQRRGLDSVFCVLEVADRVSGNASLATGFRTAREFFLPSDSTDLLFLKTKICVLMSKGFEIMDLMEFQSVTIPQEEDLRRLGKRASTCKPLAMFRLREDEFFLCYDEYGMYVDKRGAPSRSPPVIEWEGIASHAAWHPPYILLFGPTFIEIRHVESGRLAQIITGQDIRCIWDGRGLIRPEGFDEFDDPRTPRVHAVLDDSEMSSSFSTNQPHSRSPPKRQHVVVLAPTERLVVPGTRYSPSLLSVADTLPVYVP